jgi:hypothetical protein
MANMGHVVWQWIEQREKPQRGQLPPALAAMPQADEREDNEGEKIGEV